MLAVRLLIDPPAAGAWNMALDEALLERAAAEGVGTLRFYAWEPATLSLGYFQVAADRGQHGTSRDCPLVRRASGGGAILHDRELTYSIALPQQGDDKSAAGALYDTFHETLVVALARQGIEAAIHHPAAGSCEPAKGGAEPFLCFQRRACGDIVCEGFKIVGSAQRRRRGAVLQHGSILLARSSFAPELPGMEDLHGRSVNVSSLRSLWQSLLAERMNIRFEPAELDQLLAERAAAIAQVKFGATAFTHQR